MIAFFISVLGLTVSFLVCFSATSLAGSDAETKASELPVAKEVDPRLKPDNVTHWGFYPAKLTDPGLPRVLLIGDSTLAGYKDRAITLLQGQANVDCWINPYFQSAQVNELLEKVLDHASYDLVQFNLGLHGWAKGRIKEGTYKPLTKGYVEILRRRLPHAVIIWASTTPVTSKSRATDLDAKINPIIVEHNQLASEVMKEMNVPVNDFYALLRDRLELARGDQFHWKPEAYEILARATDELIIRELKTRKGASPSHGSSSFIKPTAVCE